MKKRITALVIVLAVFLSLMAGAQAEGNPDATAEPEDARKIQDILPDISAIKERNRNFRTAGSIVTFGSYEQDNDKDNGTEAIEWMVLEVKDNQALLLSVYGLELKQYHSKRGRTSWSQCSLRQWMNGSFLKKAFSKKEQAAILQTTVKDKSTGKTSKDRIFLLSAADVTEYLPGKEDRLCKPTPYVLAGKKVPRLSEEGYADWWLMNVIPKSSKAYVITRSNQETTVMTTSADIMVRPVIRIDLKKVPD